MNVYGPTNWPSPYPEVNDIINEQTPSPETLPTWKRCAQNGWAPHSFYLTEPVCSGCYRTREQPRKRRKSMSHDFWVFVLGVGVGIIAICAAEAVAKERERCARIAEAEFGPGRACHGCASYIAVKIRDGQS